VNGDNGWHIDKRVQVGHLVTTIVVAVSAVIYVQRLEQAQAVAMAEIAHLRNSDAAQDARWMREIAALQQRLDRIESKLDAVIERRARSDR